ncbi:hypothetical protein ARMGADRAFT_1031237 [Armillaria gallica]|uniref:Uncharacterized protein n=1 Tax=Armillaria gallica TaxID=47427 RepID=A0A2H3DVQ7_ARMGA|nr:hypothetical protein ARMGADRAFT_1031237 [Armillaria gallica]
MPSSKKNAMSKTPVKPVAPKSVPGNLSAKVLAVLGSGQELTLAALPDDEPTDKFLSNNTCRQSDRIKTPSSKVKASLCWTVSPRGLWLQMFLLRAVRVGLHCAPSDSHNSTAQNSDADNQSLPAPPPSKRAKSSKGGGKKVLAHRPGVVLQALKAINLHYESVGQASPIAMSPEAKAYASLHYPGIYNFCSVTFINGFNPPLFLISSVHLLFYSMHLRRVASPVLKDSLSGGNLLHIPADSPPPSSPPVDTPSPRKRRMIVASPLENEEPTPSGMSLPSLPLRLGPLPRAERNLFVDDEAEESEVNSAASDEDGDAEDGEECEEEVESEGVASDVGSDADDAPLDDTNNTSDNDPDAQSGQDDAASDGDGEPDEPGDLSDNSIVCHAKVHSGPRVVRPELHDPDLDQMGIYDKKPKCTYCALVPFSEWDGTVCVVDFATCKSTFNYEGVVHGCCGFLFEHHGDFVNTSKCDPDMFTVPKFPVMNLADTNHMVIDIVIGVCMECSLCAVASEGLHNLYRIVIMPFAQHVSSAGIAFTTRWEVVDKGEGASKKSKSKPPPSKALPPPPPPS